MYALLLIKQEMNKIIATKSRRFSAYCLDSIIIWILSYMIISNLLPTKTIEAARLNSFLTLFIDLISIILNFVYYIFFWNQSGFKSTLGQLICNLKIEKKATFQQCIKRLILMNVSMGYFWLAVSYMYLRKLTGATQDRFMLVAILSTMTIQLVYTLYINNVDHSTGIEVVDR